MLEGLVKGQRQEGFVRYLLAVGESEFTQGLTILDKSGNGFIANKPALVKINFKDIGAVLGEGCDGRIFELLTIIELELDGESV